jgi:hypothetical protein
MLLMTEQYNMGVEQYKTSQNRMSTEQGTAENDRYWDTANRQNTTGEVITKKNPGARIQDREDNVSSLCGVRLCNK